GGPMVSIRVWIEGLLLRAIAFYDAPDGADLGRRDLLLVRGAPMLLDVRDDLRPRTAGRPPAPAGDFHQHAKSLPCEGVPCRTWRSPKTSKSRPFYKSSPRSCASQAAGSSRRA